MTATAPSGKSEARGRSRGAPTRIGLEPISPGAWFPRVKQRWSGSARPFLFAVDRNPFDVGLRLRRLGHRHGQHPVLERRGHLVLVHVVDRNAPFKMPVIPLAEAPLLVLGLGLLLALDREHAVCKFDLHVFFVKTGQFGRHLHVLVAFADLDVWPARCPVEHAAATEGSELEAPEDVVEEPVHFAVQSQERAGFFAARRSHLTPAAPGDQVSDSHRLLLLIRGERTRSAGTPAPRGRGVQRCRGAQAACWCSSCLLSLPALPIAIRRGFVASGGCISRGDSPTRSIFSRPASNEAFLTSTKSAKLKTRRNGRAEIPW